ncbi:MAG: tetratricopeptide repeat protein [Kiritimatiellae bacterium]|nr:tetratricopeptide repeat protein [Kiritimatiellia bacterium]
MKKNWLLAGALGLVAAVVHFSSMADYVFPGESAHLIAVWKGLETDAVVQYPFMALFAKALGAGNLLAPICGTLSVVMLFHLVAAFVGWRIGDKAVASEREGVSLVAATTAAVVFLFSPAVRSAATHLEPRMFDFTWALLSFALAIPFLRRSKKGMWPLPLAMGAMAALGVCDSVLFVTLLPFYFIVTLVAAFNRKRRPYVPLFLFTAAALGVAVLALGFFEVEISDFLHRIAEEAKVYYTTPGWLFIMLFTTIPFVLALFSSGKAFGERPALVQWLFHGAMTFVAILSVATPLSPSSLMEPYGVTPVATSAFAAAVCGYLVAFWWMNRRKTVGLVCGVILAFVLAVTAAGSLFSFDGDEGAFADRVARKIISDLDGRRWFVTNGVLDDNLKLMAKEMDKDVNIISLAKDLDERYLKQLDELVEKEKIGGSKNGTLRLSLSLGVLPFVQDWFASDPAVAKNVAVFGAPDLWYAAGIASVPEFFFFGADDARQPDWGAWKEFDAVLAAPKGWGSYHDRKVTNPAVRMRLWLRRHLGFVANNRGVYLQDKKRDDEAFAMYELVLNEIDHDNICSIFNEVCMIGQKHPMAMAKQRELERMMKTAVEDKRRRYRLWGLSTYYGYIRNPDMFIRDGREWALSGRPGHALSQVRRAIDLVPSDKRSIMLNMMASLYASENDQKKSRSVYEEVLAHDEKDHDALIGLMRLELLEGNSKKAIEYLQRAAENTFDGRRARIELAMVAMMKNDLRQAKTMLKKATDVDPKDMQAWSLLAAVVMQQIDAAKDEAARIALLKELENEIMPSMENRAVNQFDYYLQATKGFVFLRQAEENRRKARDAFVLATQARPDISVTHDLVLGLDISLNDKENAELHAKEVLRRNRNAPLANYVMGSLSLGRGKYSEAEMYLRRAADAPQPVAMALNDLAELLRRQKNYPEAERYARKATERAPRLYAVWETLGSVLMDANRSLDEAEACIRKACQLSKDSKGNEVDVRMMSALARVQVRRNDMQHAKVTIRKVRSRISELSEFEKREFEEIVKGVR